MTYPSKAELLLALPAEWPVDLLPAIQAQVAASGRKIVVLDDDPTGTQTVYDIAVLTEWSVERLHAELGNAAPAFYILTNSRSMALPAAQACNAEIGRNLQMASQACGRDFVVVSRSDSTLRGHYPGETDALAAALEADVDATLLIPFFLEGGRYTIGDVHYVAEGDQLVPAAETPFARDTAFGYQNSNLRAWVQEKTAGRTAAETVAAITLDDIRRGGPAAVAQKLGSLTHGTVCIVNAAAMRDIQVFVMGLLAAEAQGKKFLYRTAASFVQVRAGLAARPLLTQAALDLPANGGGLVVVGSYVPKTTSQVHELLALPDLLCIEVSVEKLLADDEQGAEIQAAVQAANAGLQQDQDVVIYTSRELVAGYDAERSLTIGRRVSDSLVEIVRAISTRPRYLLAKGGITSSDVATKGLDVRRALVLGQILPGVPVWRTGDESRHPGLAYIVFPGNVGDSSALVQVVTALGRIRE